EDVIPVAAVMAPVLLTVICPDEPRLMPLVNDFKPEKVWVVLFTNPGLDELADCIYNVVLEIDAPVAAAVLPSKVPMVVTPLPPETVAQVRFPEPSFFRYVF